MASACDKCCHLRSPPRRFTSRALTPSPDSSASSSRAASPVAPDAVTDDAVESNAVPSSSSVGLLDMPDDVLVHIFNELDANSLRSMMHLDNARLRDVARAHINSMIRYYSTVWSWFQTGIYSWHPVLMMMNDFKMPDVTNASEVLKRLQMTVWPSLLELRDTEAYGSHRNCRQYCEHISTFMATHQPRDYNSILFEAYGFIFFIVNLMIPRSNIKWVKKPTFVLFNPPASYYMHQYKYMRFIKKMKKFCQRCALATVHAMGDVERKAIAYASVMGATLSHTTRLRLPHSVQLVPQFFRVRALTIANVEFSDLLRVLAYLKNKTNLVELTIEGAPYDPSSAKPPIQLPETVQEVYYVRSAMRLTFVRCQFLNDDTLRWLVRRIGCFDQRICTPLRREQLHFVECERVTSVGLDRAFEQPCIGRSSTPDFDVVLWQREQISKEYLRQYLKHLWRALDVSYCEVAEYVHRHFVGTVVDLQVECGRRMISDGIEEGLKHMPEVFRFSLPRFPVPSETNLKKTNHQWWE